MDRQIELYLQDILKGLATTESRKLEIKRELHSHISEMLEDCQEELKKEDIDEVIRNEFGEVEEISDALNAVLKRGGNWNMERKSFIRRIVLPPMLVFGVFLLMLLGAKLSSFIDYKPFWHVVKNVTGLIGVASFISAPGVISLLCFYQGGSLLERLVLGLISPFVFIFFSTATEASVSIFIWLLLHPVFIGVIGGAVLQVAFVEIWARYKMSKYHTALAVE